ncbi:YggS family pyridoxal phosphate-dependent enzyme [bacterium]|nr:YggS family pyridoxal phosphate-dependent enzyme [bacterium]
MSLNSIKLLVHSQEDKLGVTEGSTRIIAVSKLQPNERVELVLKSGHRIFGENRVQEAHAKWPKFKEKFKNIELHLLGPLQRNKVRDAVELFDFIHTVDNIKLAKRISLIMEETGRRPKLFIQVNTGNEPQKAGVGVDNLENLLTTCSELRLPVVGLMCIPPVLEDPYPHFEALRALKEKHGLSELSIGMSNDFEKAILAGASYIRVGSAIFGQRP